MKTVKIKEFVQEQYFFLSIQSELTLSVREGILRNTLSLLYINELEDAVLSMKGKKAPDRMMFPTK